jgi:tubulin polyglutamylase TTLL4
MATPSGGGGAAAAVGGVGTAVCDAGDDAAVLVIDHREPSPDLDESFLRALPDATEDGDDADEGDDGIEEDEQCESDGDDDAEDAAVAEAAAAAAATAAAAAAKGMYITTSPAYDPDAPPPVGLLSALVPCPFDTFSPTIRFQYSKDGVTVEQFAPETKKLLKWHMTKTTSTLIRNMIGLVGFKNTNTKTWVGQWGSHMKPSSFKNVLNHQKVNHFPGSFRIGRKDSLWKAISGMQSVHGKKEFDFLAECYLLNRDRPRLKRDWEKGFGGAGKQKWIIKPNASARGIGIRVVTDFNQVPKKKSCLVQRYLQHPYLVNETKFDCRIYVYVTSYDPLRVYICLNGLARFATCKYSNKKGSASNRFMHLTNYSINVKSDEFVQNEDATAAAGHKWGLDTLLKHLKEELGVDTEKVWADIEGVIIKTLMAADGVVNSQTKSNTRQRSCVHELFGFDIFLDRDLKPWLIEVNISPSLAGSSQLDKDIKGKMLRDLFNLSGYTLPQDPDAEREAEAPPRAEEGGMRTLTSEEKAKHAYYITIKDERERKTIIDNLTTDDVLMLMETEAENSRRGALRRLVPNTNASKYLKYTDTQRYYNTLMDVWTHRWADDPASGVAFLRQLAVDAGQRKPGELYRPAQFAMSHHRKFVSTKQVYRAPPLSDAGRKASLGKRKKSSTGGASGRTALTTRSVPSSPARSNLHSAVGGVSPRRPSGAKPPTGPKQRGGGAASSVRGVDSGLSSARSRLSQSGAGSTSSSRAGSAVTRRTALTVGTASLPNSPQRRVRMDSGGSSAGSATSRGGQSIYDHEPRDGAVPGDSRSGESDATSPLTPGRVGSGNTHRQPLLQPSGGFTGSLGQLSGGGGADRSGDPTMMLLELARMKLASQDNQATQEWLSTLTQSHAAEEEGATYDGPAGPGASSGDQQTYRDRMEPALSQTNVHHIDLSEVLDVTGAAKTTGPAGYKSKSITAPTGAGPGAGPGAVGGGGGARPSIAHASAKGSPSMLAPSTMTPTPAPYMVHRMVQPRKLVPRILPKLDPQTANFGSRQGAVV